MKNKWYAILHCNDVFLNIEVMRDKINEKMVKDISKYNFAY